MDKETFEKLITDLPIELKAKGVTLFNGVMAGMNAYKNDKTASSLKNWKASETALDEFVNSISANPVNEKTFSGIPAIVEYLHTQGWKVSQRTAYNHRDKQLLLPRKDGKFYQSDVDRYAASGVLSRIDGTKQEAPDVDLDRKKKAEADSAVYDARIKKIKAEAIEGKYVDRDKLKDELSAQALAFRNSIQTYIHGQAEEIVSFVNGNTSKIPDLIEFMLVRADEHFLKCAEQMEKTGPFIDADQIDADDLSAGDDLYDDARMEDEE